MTEGELRAIEGRCDALDERAVRSGTFGLSMDVRALVAEVRRLRGLIAKAEWSAGTGDTSDWVVSGACPWCAGTAPDDKNFPGEGHTDTCPAFPRAR